MDPDTVTADSSADAVISLETIEVATPVAPVVAPVVEPSDDELLAIALAHTDPDGPTVAVRTSYRDLSCSMSGPQVYRQFIWPGASEPVWPDQRLPAFGGTNASSRRATCTEQIPIGSVVIDYEQQVYKGKKGRAKVTIGVLCEHAGKGKIVWVDHKTLRSRPVYEVDLLGRKIEIPRRADT